MTKQFITPKGKVQLKQRITKLEQYMVDIREEKTIAYTASGDTWHDNPGFNALEQAEHRKVCEIVQLQKLLNTAYLINIEQRNTYQVEVGSIVECIRIESEGKKQTEKEEIWEIGGVGESNPKERILSYQTPVGTALLKHKAGDETETVEIAGKKITFEIVELHSNWETALKGILL